MTLNKVLLVDDNNGQRITLESVLLKAGFQVSSADSGTAALELARSENFAAALLDIKMPDITGIEVLKEIKIINPDTTVIMMTGYAESDFAIDALNAGAAAYVLKPANIDQIKGFLNQAIERARLIEENNDMSEALREFNTHLEKKVEDRTQQLVNAHNLMLNLYEELKKNFQSTLEVLAIAIDQRDPLTYSHSFRVTQYSVELGKLLGLGEQDQEILRYAGLLHDLGKIEVKKEILCKEGSLTTEEYKQIQEHASGTFELLSKFKFKSHLRNVPLIASSHHERFDGKGYPNGLKAEDIPLHARLLAVADVLDAITSKRHYRSAMSFDNVLGILKRESGAQFDPQCIDTLLKMNAANFLKIHLADHLSQCDTARLIELEPYSLKYIDEICQKEDLDNEELSVLQHFHTFYQGPVPKKFEGKITPAQQFEEAA